MRSGRDLGQSVSRSSLVEGAKSGILSNYYSSCVRDLPHVAKFVEDQLITDKGVPQQLRPRGRGAVDSH